MSSFDRVDPHILLADTNALCIAGLIQAVRRSFSEAIVSVAMSRDGVTDHLSGPNPPVLLLLDGALPGLGGAEGIRRLIAMSSSLAVILVAKSPDVVQVKEVASAAGIRDCLTGTEQDHEITAMIRGAVKTQLDDTPRWKTVRAGEDRYGEPRLQRLTCRQMDIVRMLASGMSNRQIGSILGICEGTVKAHLLSAYRQMGARNRIEAVRVLQSQGIGRRSPDWEPSVELGR
ncbi:response regulator transcription factor [Roseibacterium beibuensis]|uniref:response regulator transcription factor n=1 Tax=[Roseibacterium] beibuensis TaxID=1193142 RepID=UPI00217DF1E9|nr:response regulator transcription factor [Roseibacterium beibuensis]MCS6627904.1 response regulator transcription factor [Roseibacterium beibuensis]